MECVNNMFVDKIDNEAHCTYFVRKLNRPSLQGDRVAVINQPRSGKLLN